MRSRAIPALLAVGAVAALVAFAAYELRTVRSGLAETVEANMAASGVEHPVTAVLLNFRGYDTWLELIVLILAAVAALDGRLEHASTAQGTLARDRVMSALLVVLAPAAILVAGYLLKAGAYAPGGAFQAGAVLAAALVLLHLAGRTTLAALPVLVVRVLLVLGATVFLLAAAAGLLLESTLLAYPVAHAGAVILAIEAAATLSIAVALAALVNGQVGR